MQTLGEAITQSLILTLEKREFWQREVAREQRKRDVGRARLAQEQADYLSDCLRVIARTYPASMRDARALIAFTSSLT